MPTLETVQTWVDHIVLKIHEQERRDPRPLTPGELEHLTGLDAGQVSRGCWHGRIHGLLRFDRSTDRPAYRLTPLGMAMGRRLAAAGNGHPHV